MVLPPSIRIIVSLQPTSEVRKVRHHIHSVLVWGSHLVTAPPSSLNAAPRLARPTLSGADQWATWSGSVEAPLETRPAALQRAPHPRATGDFAQ